METRPLKSVFVDLRARFYDLVVDSIQMVFQQTQKQLMHCTVCLVYLKKVITERQYDV